MFTSLFYHAFGFETTSFSALHLLGEKSWQPSSEIPRSSAGAEERAAKQRDQVAASHFFNSTLTLPARLVEAELEKVRDRLLPTAEQPIRSFMSVDLVSVRRHTPQLEVVQDMVEAHVHRLLVLDDAETLVGIVSTTDVLAALLRDS